MVFSKDEHFPLTTSIFSSSFSFFSFSFFLALAVMERTAVDTCHAKREQRCFHSVRQYRSTQTFYKHSLKHTKLVDHKINCCLVFHFVLQGHQGLWNEAIKK